MVFFAMPTLEPSIFDEIDEAAEVEADARAEADVSAGRVVSHEAVSRWLAAWGSATPPARPKCGE
jgi:predicted transcriptional regulator